jgi:hypothetical protein
MKEAVGLTWISVGELGAAFQSGPESASLAPTPRLAGRRMRLEFEDGSAADYHFQSAEQLTRPAAGGEEAAESYRATEIRPGILFVDFIARDRVASTTSLVLDLDQGICTALEGFLPSEAEARVPLIDRVKEGGELTRVKARFLSGAIDAAFTRETRRHPETRELTGKRVEYTYSSTERYEHLYLNERFFTWQCLSGSEQGLADTERCHYFKVAERLYFFVWREKIVPTLGAVLVDLARMRSTGKIFGYRGFDFTAVVNFPIGARAR